MPLKKYLPISFSLELGELMHRLKYYNHVHCFLQLLLDIYIFEAISDIFSFCYLKSHLAHLHFE